MTEPRQAAIRVVNVRPKPGCEEAFAEAMYSSLEQAFLDAPAQLAEMAKRQGSLTEGYVIVTIDSRATTRLAFALRRENAANLADTDLGALCFNAMSHHFGMEAPAQGSA